ncbi:response regulator transcription factor [Paraburkholderia guartelaensis]|uniref:Response regulator transcription factor n=1 Tax=Paraburkholderia guartelaensis TaxID=2546446 RepID=A0A4R5L7N8_9BURK|nr:response regulator [Paraburkholderia guartelaensis]TDG04009.1 response regulator transcription factor [Paraburkholderia guartelaensis]
MSAVKPAIVSREATASPPESIVYVVDDEDAMRRSLSGLLESVGLSVETFASSRDFMASPKLNAPSCLILDVRLRCENGLEFQDAMGRHGLRMPVVIITGHGDIEMSVKAMKSGAMDFLTKPFRDQDVLDAVSHALTKDRERLNAERSVDFVRAEYETLTPREREVAGFILAGLLNKQIAAEMDVSEVTVKMHRGQVMKKLSVRSVAELVAKLGALGIDSRTKKNQ